MVVRLCDPTMEDDQRRVLADSDPSSVVAQSEAQSSGGDTGTRRGPGSCDHTGYVLSLCTLGLQHT